MSTAATAMRRTAAAMCCATTAATRCAWPRATSMRCGRSRCCGVGCATACCRSTIVVSGTAAANCPATVTVIGYAARSAVVASTAFTTEAVPAPAVTIAPAPPGSHAQEDAVIEIARPIITVGRACIGCIAIVAIGTDRLNPDANTNGWNTDSNHNLCFCRWR